MSNISVQAAVDRNETNAGRARLDDLIAGANASGFTIDYLEALTRGLSGKARRRVIDNLTALPAKMTTIENPSVRRKACTGYAD